MPNVDPVTVHVAEQRTRPAHSRVDARVREEGLVQLGERRHDPLRLHLVVDIAEVAPDLEILDEVVARVPGAQVAVLAVAVEDTEEPAPLPERGLHQERVLVPPVPLVRIEPPLFDEVGEKSKDKWKR